jgi:hypothetical protein
MNTDLSSRAGQVAPTCNHQRRAQNDLRSSLIEVHTSAIRRRAKEDEKSPVCKLTLNITMPNESGAEFDGIIK